MCQIMGSGYLDSYPWLAVFYWLFLFVTTFRLCVHKCIASDRKVMSAHMFVKGAIRFLMKTIPLIVILAWHTFSVSGGKFFQTLL